MSDPLRHLRKGPPALLDGSAARRLVVSLSGRTEKAEIVNSARRAGLSVSEYVRRILFGVDDKTRERLAKKEIARA